MDNASLFRLQQLLHQCLEDPNTSTQSIRERLKEIELFVFVAARNVARAECRMIIDASEKARLEAHESASHMLMPRICIFCEA